MRSFFQLPSQHCMLALAFVVSCFALACTSESMCGAVGKPSHSGIDNRVPDAVPTVVGQIRFSSPPKKVTLTPLITFATVAKDEYVTIEARHQGQNTPDVDTNILVNGQVFVTGLLLKAKSDGHGGYVIGDWSADFFLDHALAVDYEAFAVRVSCFDSMNQATSDGWTYIRPVHK